MEGAEAGAAVAAAAAAPDTDGVQVMEEGNWNQCCILLTYFAPASLTLYVYQYISIAIMSIIYILLPSYFSFSSIILDLHT